MKLKRLITRVWPGVIVALALSLTGCGDTSESGADSEAVPTVSGPKGDPIRIGLICTCSGSQQANAASKQVAAAWTNFIHAEGGLNGHSVEVIVKDDGGSPAASLKAARELVEGEKVMAIVGQTSLVDSAWQQYVEEKQVPVVGGISFPSTMFTSPMFFPSGANILAETYAFITQAKSQGITKMGAFYCAEAPQCAQVAPLLEGIGGQVIGGVSLVNSAAISASAPSYVSQCLQAKDAGVQGLAVYASPDIVDRVREQCAQQGFKPRFIGINGVLPYSAAESGEYDGAIVALGNLPLGNANTPGGEDFMKAMEDYAPETIKDPTWNANPAQAWMGLQLFAKAAEAGDIDPKSTSADVLAALYALDGETLDGLSGPLTFTKGQPNFQACPFIVEIKDGEWVTQNDDKPLCVPAEGVQALVKVASGG